MTYEQLLALNAVVSEGTFRGAALRLNKSQPAVSHMIKKLEDEISVTLLSREEYRPKLTVAGSAFYRQSLRVLHQMQELSGVVKSLNAETEAEVFLAVTATYSMANLLEIIGECGKDFPSTHIRMSRETMGGPLEKLLRFDADMIIATMDGVPTDDVEAAPISTVTILPVAHPDFEPAQSQHMRTAHQMQSYTQIIVADSSEGEFEQSRDVMPSGLRWTVSDFAAKKEILCAGLGWGGMPKHLIEDQLARGELVVLDVDGYPPRHSRIYKIRRRDHTFGRVAQSIWEKLTPDLTLKTP